ncbi:MAG TPA: hypothetical protein PK358_01035 [Spirochaetota bacterium]|nr:hypothetical protein [Spirochaetota bacterium]HPJ33386.1 hypothetical protein [Spirochaetota bacterium]
MDILLYLAGLIIGIAAFLYVYSLISDGKEAIRKLGEPGEKPPVQNIDTGTVAFRNRPALPPGTRICPLCGSSLTKYEGLYASKTIERGSEKLMIMGCRYCYRENEDPEKPKKSSI